MDSLKPWQRAIAALAVAKVIFAVALILTAFGTRAAETVPRDLLMLANIAVFGSAAAFLLILGRRDLRATALGVLFLVTAAVFGDSARRFIPASWPFAIVRFLFALQVDAFSAYFLWFFIQEFPRVATFGARRRVPRLAMRAALGLGIALFVLNIAYFVASSRPELASVQSILSTFDRSHRGLYWILQYGFHVAGLAALIWKATAAPVTERRRVAILIGGLICGCTPTTLWVFLSVSVPGFKEAVPIRYAGWVLYPTLWTLPMTTAYAVLVHRALNVTLIIRGAIRYAFARYTVLALAGVPTVMLLVTVYQQRHQRMVDLIEGSNGVLLLALIILVLVAARSQRGMLERIDRRFFREQYDARHILGGLIDTCRRASSRAELADSLRIEIDRALHLTSLAILFLDDDRANFSSPRGEIRPLSAASPLHERLASGGGFVEVDLERGTGFAASLTNEERYWLVDAGARALLPMRGSDHKLIGFLVLGEKRSELPFSDEDRIVLSTVASAAAMSSSVLGGQQVPHMSQPPTASSAPDAAAICVVCGRVDNQNVAACRKCGGPMVRAAIPRLLAGKFQLMDRIGEGGMGVVYRGLDLTLDRVVAIKALPRLLPDQAARLRREARAMATISHPNLALIYGAESWNGLPILIVEFLPGGTLSTRLRSGPLPLREALVLGIALAEVIGALHTAGILHRDVKPSNIGYTSDGTPKLLDFGLARLLSRASGPERQTMEKHVSGIVIPAGDGGPAELRATASVEGQVVGTPLYLSPEAIAGLEPDPTFDIWSICVVLFEAIAGANPVEDSTVAGTLHRIRYCDATDLSTVMPTADRAVAEFFRRAFSADRDERPADAGALRDQLAALLATTTGHRGGRESSLAGHRLASSR